MTPDRPLCILQVTPALDAGGVERTTIEVAEAVAQRGGRALVASRGGRLESELAAVGGELAPMPLETKTPWGILSNAGRLEALARQANVSLIHARSRAPAWSALLAARRAGVPFVTTYHGVYNGQSGAKKFYNSVMARGDVVIANSGYTRDHLIKTHRVDPDRVVTIPRGVDLVRFDPAAIDRRRVDSIRSIWGIAAGETRPIVLVPARLTYWKGQSLLIEAAALIERARPGAALYILAGDSQGRADYVSDLHAKARELGVSEAVRVVGHLVDMPAALSASTLAAFPVLEPEAFGRAAVEAQAMGVPVVASDLGGLSETIVAGETGLLVKSGDARALADAITHVLDMTPEARREMGARGAARTRSLYSTRSLQTATLAVYDRLLAGRRT